MSEIPAAKNEPDDIRIRKYRDTLVNGGLAVVAFGCWTVVKGILEAASTISKELGNISFEEFSETEAAQLRAAIEDHSFFWSIMLVIVVMLLCELALRAYVGLSARAVGLQKKKRNGKERSSIVWLIFGLILLASNVYMLIYGLMTSRELLEEHSILYFVVSLFVDVTSLYVTAEVVFTGFRLRGLNKKQEEEVRDAA